MFITSGGNMRIGLNILYLIPGGVGGTETYARHLISAMTKQLKAGDELVIYATRETAPTFAESKHVKVITMPIYARSRFTRLLAEQLLLPLYLIHDRINVIFSLGYSSPLLHPCPAVVTIHDLNWYYHPEDFGWMERIAWKCITILSAFSATHIVSISQATTNSLTGVLKISNSKISTILHGSPQKYEGKKGKRILDNDYIFTVLAGYPHKNLITLLKAFNIVSKKHNKLSLVVCGLSGKADDICSKYIKDNSLDNKVKILGYVSDNILIRLYQHATIFVFPSAYEGFGIPVLEAMSYGVPVISSNAFSLKEVINEGGILVDAYDVDGYIKNINLLLGSPKKRQDLTMSGYERISRLKWSKSAKEYLEVLKKLGNNK